MGDLEEEKKEVGDEEVKAAVVRQTTSNKVLFKKLNSKIAIATIMSYLVTWRQAPKLFNCLSKLGAEYFERNKKQLRGFIESAPLKRVILTLGESKT